MTGPARIGVAQVRASLNPNVEVEAPVRWFGRPLANLITPYFHNNGWTANGVTAARGWLGLLSVAFLAVPQPYVWPVAALGYYACFVLDCVDGNLARIQGNATYYGKFLDGAVDFVFPIGAALCAGAGAWLQYEEPVWFGLGAAIAVACAFNHMLRSRLSFFREWMVAQTGPLTDTETTAAKSAQRVQRIVGAIYGNGYFLSVAVLLLPRGGATAFLILTAIVQLLPDLVWIATTLAESKATLGRTRTSRHAAKAAVSE